MVGEASAVTSSPPCEESARNGALITAGSRRIAKGTASESTEHDAVVSVQQTDTQHRPHFVFRQCGIFFADVPISI